MKYIIVFLFVIIHVLFGKELGYSSSSPIYTHFTYVFQHTGWIHIILNSFALISFLNILSKIMPNCLVFTYAYTAAIIASFMSIYNNPTVGASGMVYAMAGMFASISIIGRKLTIIDRRKFYMFLICLSISFFVGYAKSSVNSLCHLSSFFIGLIIGWLDNKIYK